MGERLTLRTSSAHGITIGFHTRLGDADMSPIGQRLHVIVNFLGVVRSARDRVSPPRWRGANRHTRESQSFRPNTKLTLVFGRPHTQTGGRCRGTRRETVSWSTPFGAV